MINIFNKIRKNTLDWYCSNCGKIYSFPKPNNKCPRCGGDLI